jgi:hypothetical protein
MHDWPCISSHKHTLKISRLLRPANATSILCRSYTPLLNLMEEEKTLAPLLATNHGGCLAPFIGGRMFSGDAARHLAQWARAAPIGPGSNS